MEKRFSIMAVVASVALLGGALTISGISESNTTAISPFGTQTIPLTGHVTLTVYGADGNIKQYIQGDNLVVNLGENCIGEAIFGGNFGCAGSGGAIFNDMAIGTANHTPVDGDVGLTNQVAGQSNGDIVINPASGGNPASATITSTFVNPGINTYREAGLFDSENNLLALNLFTTVADLTDSEDDLVVSWQIDIGG